MKQSWPLFLLLLSCGKLNLPNDVALRTLNSTEPVSIKVGTTEHEYIRRICEAIDRKTLTINALVNTNYAFTETAKDCTDNAFANLGDTAVTLVSQNGSYKFTQLNNLFYFSDVETSTEGMLSQICTNLASLSSPMRLGTSLTYFTTERISASDCPPRADEQCIKIENAVTEMVEKEEKGRVHTREWIRVRLEEPRRGFATYRKRISHASCLEGYFLGRTATLK